VAAAWGPYQATAPDKVAEFVHAKRWLDAVGARPAVQRGMAIPAA